MAYIHNIYYLKADFRDYQWYEIYTDHLADACKVEQYIWKFPFVLIFSEQGYLG